MLTDFQTYFTVRIKRTFVTKLSLKIPPHLRVRRYTPLWNVSVLKATVENKATSVSTHFKSASSNRKADTLSNWCKNCRMRQLLQIITQTINTFFPVVRVICRLSVSRYCLYCQYSNNDDDDDDDTSNSNNATIYNAAGVTIQGCITAFKHASAADVSSQ